MKEKVKHPARFSAVLLEPMASMLRGRTKILDPFAGVGGIYKLLKWLPDATIEAVEIEPEWAQQDDRITLGSALHLPWEDGYFDAICTSPAYGNRMADKVLLDKYQRNTYANELGRNLHPDSGAAVQWGPKYRSLHESAWAEARRVLYEGGAFVLNIKDHIRNGKLQAVTDWHISCIESLGFSLIDHRKIETPGNGYGAWRTVRVPHESIILFNLPLDNGGTM